MCAGATLTGGVSAAASAERCRTHQCGLNEGADAKVDRCAADSGRPASGARKALVSSVLRNWVAPSRANYHWCSGPKPLQPRPTGMGEGAQSRAGGGGGTWRRTTAITSIQMAQKLRKRRFTAHYVFTTMYNSIKSQPRGFRPARPTGAARASAIMTAPRRHEYPNTRKCCFVTRFGHYAPAMLAAARPQAHVE